MRPGVVAGVMVQSVHCFLLLGYIIVTFASPLRQANSSCHMSGTLQTRSLCADRYSDIDNALRLRCVCVCMCVSRVQRSPHLHLLCGCRCTCQ